jgi:succinate dehydrogenase / fumarate reductase, flavoprotein subunit
LGAAQHAEKVGALNLDRAELDQAEREILAPFQRMSGENPYAIHHDLQEVMQTLVGIFRTDEDLRNALSEIEKLKARAANVHVEGSRVYNPGWHLSRDLQCMLTVSEACTHAALARKESRGAHSRLDYPKTEDAWGTKNYVIAKKDGAMNLFEVQRPPLPEELQQILAEDK